MHQRHVNETLVPVQLAEASCSHLPGKERCCPTGNSPGTQASLWSSHQPLESLGRVAISAYIHLTASQPLTPGLCNECTVHLRQHLAQIQFDVLFFSVRKASGTYNNNRIHIILPSHSNIQLQRLAPPCYSIWSVWAPKDKTNEQWFLSYGERIIAFTWR